MPELESLTSSATELASKVDFWNSAVVWVLFITAIAAGATVVSQRLAFVRAKQLSEVQDQIAKIKENSAAERANSLEQSNVRLQTDLANAETKLEGERVRRLQLQRTVLHRMIPQLGEGEKRNYDSLKRFKGTRVVFEYSPEGEPGRFAGNLAPFAINSGWGMLDEPWTKEVGHLPDGVMVESYVGLKGETDSSTGAAESLATFLRANNIDGVRRLSAKKGELPPNAVRVRIGQMPDPFADPK